MMQTIWNSRFSNDDETVESVKESEQSSEIENEIRRRGKLYGSYWPDEAFAAVQLYVQQPECNSTELLLSKRIEDLTAK